MKLRPGRLRRNMVYLCSYYMAKSDVAYYSSISIFYE